MRDHDFDTEERALRPKGGRLDEQSTDQVGRAAAEGRTDVLDGAGVLHLQRAAGNRGVASLMEDEPSPVRDVVSSGGRPLDPDVRTDMETRLGHDFGDVRVHTDSKAHDSAQAVNARAYTVGRNVVFQRDAYDPSSDAGKVTLAHELTHVAQQRSGPVDGTPAPGGINLSHPSDRFEREAASTAERAMAMPATTPTPTPAPAPSVQREADDQTPPPVQRQEEEETEDEETTAQGEFLQRQEEEEEEQA
jgi:hypothetical protein